MKHYKKPKYSSNEVRSYHKNIIVPKVSSHIRSNNKPIQYQKGYAEFYKLKFKVSPDVLIPRPETELLVDEVLSFTGSDPGQGPTLNQSLTILDLGTGAGNIAISLACNLGGYNVKIIASDVSAKALKVAQQNAKLHGVKDKIRFIESDLLNAFCHSESKAKNIYPSLITQDDNLIIVTNLPYIPSARIPYLDSSVKDFEPHLALDGGKDGFELYRKLFAQIKEKGWQPKLIIGEIDYTHNELAVNEAQKYFPYSQIEVKKDLAHKQRILFIYL